MSRADFSHSTAAPIVQAPSISILNRRSLLAGASAAVISATTGAVAGSSDPLDALWRQRNALIAQSHQLAAAHAAAVGKMPEWARPGPAYIDSAGRPCGETVPWPRRLDATPPTTPAGRRLARPGRQSIEADYRSERRTDPAGANHFRTRRLAALAERLEAQRAEEDRAGVADLQIEIEANWFAAMEIEKQIAAGPVTINAVAALLLIDISYDAKSTSTLAAPDTALSAALRPLRFIRAQLTGELALDVAALLDGPADASLSSLRFCAA